MTQETCPTHIRRVRSRARRTRRGLLGLAAPAFVAASLLLAQAAHAAGAAPGCIPPRLNGSAQLPGSPLSVSPLPDSLDASPRTQISLLGVAASQLRDLNVTGSRTGRRAGRLEPYSQGDGASFLVSGAFAVGETVTVRGKVRAQPFAFHFRISDPDPIPRPALTSSVPLPAKGRPSEYQHFHSKPTLQPPTVQIAADSPAASPGYVFLTPASGPGQNGPMIFDHSGQLIWFAPLPAHTVATDLQVQQYEGQPVLTWWQGYIPPNGFGEGEAVIANGRYQPIAHVKAGNGYLADLHEFHIYPNDTALLTVFNTIHCDLSSAGGPQDGALTDGVFQELDLKTGLVRREWHSADHVALGESYSRVTSATSARPYDYFHINSVAAEPDGSTLISARNTWGVYKLDSKTGRVLWELGGKHSSFHMGPGTRTAYQHDAAEVPGGTLTILDNGAAPKVHSQTRAIQVSLNTHTKTATLIREYAHTPALLAGSQANFQLLANGNAFIGWQLPYFSEYGPSGEVLFDGRLAGATTQSYRAYRFAWSGTPTGSPAIAAGRAPGGSVTVYASWNGATTVASWTVLAGPSPHQLTPVANAPRAGFETAIALAGPQAYVAVQAIDASGALISTSKTIKPSAG
jgi:hypothetical protein